MIRVIRSATVAGVVALASTQTIGAQQEQQGKLASFEMAWPTEPGARIARRVHAAAEVMTGQKLRQPVMAAAAARAASRRMQVTLPDAPALEAVYLPEYAELRIVDTELAASTNPRREMAETEAMAVAKRAFDDLVRREVLDGEYDWKNADVASTWVGGASRDGKTSEKKRIEYRITLRRTINGIELANAGVRIAVHVSGRVSGLRLGGVRVASKMTEGIEQPTGTGRWLARQLPVDDLRARFQRDVLPQNAKSHIAWSRVMYVMPENRRRALVEPLYVVSYSLEFPGEERETAISRRKTVGLSLVDPKAAPVDLTPPTRAHEPDKLRKPEYGAR
jgi:hypothetical protein